MPVFIKICGVRNIATALVAVEAGATAIGFVFAESPRQVSVADAREISHQMPQGIERIGVFKNATIGELEGIISEAGLDAVQVHGNGLELPIQIAGAEVIPALHPKNLFLSFPRRRESSSKENTSYHLDTGLRRYDVLEHLAGRRFVVDASEGSGVMFSPSPFQGEGRGEDGSINRQNPHPALSLQGRGVPSLRDTRAIIAGGLTPENVGRIIAERSPYGVDVSSGVESAPGVKDHERIKAFCKACQKEHHHVHERV